MTERHKDIVQQLQSAMDGAYTVSISYTAGEPIKVTISFWDNKKNFHAYHFDLADLLAIVRGVDIGEGDE